jgi:integrase
MSTLKVLPAPAKTTISSLIDLVMCHPEVPEPRRREMISALKTLARVLNREPHLIPTSAEELRVLINRALPVAAGVSGTRWRNVKSLLRQALALLDPQVMPARSQGELMPDWAELLSAPEAQPLHRGIGRFSKYCSGHGIAPAEVDQAVYERFHMDLDAHCLMRSPRETQQTAGRAWNTATATVPGWPSHTLTIERFRQNPSLPWSAFPDTLLHDVEAYVGPHARTPFNRKNDGPVFRPATIIAKKVQIRQFATALVQSGRDPSSIGSLADLVEADAATAGLTVLWGRAGEKNTTRNHTTAYLLLTIARHWVKADEPTIALLTDRCHDLTPDDRGMTVKNKTRLQQFEDPRTLAAFLDLPAKLFDQACRVTPPTKAEARMAQLALAIGILLTAPLRIKNLSELEIDRTLILNGAAQGHIVIDRTEVKNDVDIEIPLPKPTLQMIDTYLKRFHKLLAPPGCRMLWPSADGGHKRPTVLATQISACVRARCGIEMNPHLFRHLAAKLYLEAHPGAYGVVRMLLGHRSIATTIKAYCGTEYAAAFKAYDKMITDRRGDNLFARGPIRIGKGRR